MRRLLLSLGKKSRTADRPPEYLLRYEPIDPSEGYVATFIFRYRPRGMSGLAAALPWSHSPDVQLQALLQAQGVVPPSFTPVKEELRPKHGRDSDDTRPAKRPKTEPGTATTDTGVIELSDDDEDLDVLQVCCSSSTEPCSR